MDNKDSRFMIFSKEKVISRIVVFTEQKHLKAIKSSFIDTIPLIIIGSTSLILCFPPVDPEVIEPTSLFKRFLLAWYSWACNNADAILMPYNVTMGIIALFIAIAVAYNLAKSYEDNFEINPLLSGLISATVFLLITITPSKKKNSIAFLGARGLFSAVIVGILTVEITRYMLENNIVIKMPESVPPSVSKSFTLLVFILVNTSIFYGANLFLVRITGNNIIETTMKVLVPLLKFIDSIWFIIVITVITHLLWFMGIHGSSVVGLITIPLFIGTLLANAAAKVAGCPMPYILGGPLNLFAINLGGSGATITLTILLLRSKSQKLNSIGKAGIVSSFFNINETILYGTPVISNRILGIPFILAPVINSIISYYWIKLGLVRNVFIQVLWTTPAFIGLPLATMDFRALILIMILSTVDLVIYYPFFKVYEKNILEKEK